MLPKNTIKLLLDLEYTKKVQSELPQKWKVMLMSSGQFFWGVWMLAYVMKNSNEFPLDIAIFPLTLIAVGLIIFSAYTFFGYLIRKRYIMLIESITEKEES